MKKLTNNTHRPRFWTTTGFAVTCACASLLSGTAASAATLTVDALTFGIYESFGGFSHTTPDSLIRYDIGKPAEAVTARHYVVYDLSGLSDQVTSATLRIFSPGTPQSPNATDTYKVSDISTDVTTLIDPTTTGNATIFDDLNNGTVYGSKSLSAATINSSTVIDVDLSGALSDINAKRGSRFALGGAIDPLITVGDTNSGTFAAPYYFSGANNSTNPAPRLILETAPVPLPAAWVLLLGGGSCLVRFLRRR